MKRQQRAYLRALMSNHGDDISSLAKALGISKESLYQRTREVGKVNFKPHEVNFISERYGLSMEQVARIFYPDSFEFLLNCRDACLRSEGKVYIELSNPDDYVTGNVE